MSKKMINLAHWRDASNWPYAHFSPAELASKGDGSLRMQIDAIVKLERLRVKLGVPMIVTSAYRDPAHNRSVGGAKRSYHMRGQAFDIRMDNHDPVVFEAAARQVGFTGFGFYPRSGFMHIDTGRSRSWGKAFRIQESRFSPEPIPARKTQAVKEGTSVAAFSVAAERLVNEAAPLLSDQLVTYGFTGLAILALGIVVWRAVHMGRE